MIRTMTSGDILILRDIHRAANYIFPFPLDKESANKPDDGFPLIINRIVSIRENGTIIASGFHKICYETISLVKPSVTPQEKWAALKEIDSELSTRAFRQGLDIVHAAVSPIGFDKRLLQLGWKPFPDGSRLWSRKTNEVSSKASR